MNSLIVCRIAWAIAVSFVHGDWDTNINELQKYKNMGNREFGAGTHSLECKVPYALNLPAEFKAFEKSS